MTTKISKVKAATELLERAVALFLDEQAFVPAIVLAGSAEDVFQGYLIRSGREPARANFARNASRIARCLSPDAALIPEKDFVKRMRDPFNWLRHADDVDDADTADWNLREEAEHMLSRAIENMGHLLGDYPSRVDEFAAVMRQRSENRSQTAEIENSASD